MFLQFSHRLIKVLVLFSLLVSSSIYASDFYWVGGSGSWSDPSHWALSSGGTGGIGFPGSSDNVIFDDNSFDELYPLIQIPSDVTVQGFELTSNTYPTFLSSTSSITIKNELQLLNKVGFVLGGAIIFDADGGVGHEIQTNGTDFGADIVFEGGNWQLKHHLKTKRDRTIEFKGGYLKTNNFTIHSKDIVANTGSVTLELGYSHLLAVDLLDLSAASSAGDGTAAIAVADGTTSIVDKGDWGDAIMKDVVVACPNPPFTLSTFITSDYNGSAISCPDSCDLEITVVPGGTPGPFSYELDGSGTFTDITVYTGLCEGTHDWIVIDSSNEIAPGVFDQCLISDGALEPGTLTIGAPIPISNTCPDSCDGQAFTFPGGGTAPYTLTWLTSGEVTPNPVGLCDGWNVVEMLDINLCPHTDSVEITGPADINPDFTVTPPTCNGGCDGEVDANPSGGNGFTPGTVFWSTVPASGQGTDPGIGFCAGTLTLTVTDDNGCPKDTLVVIPDPPPISITLDGFTDAICNGDCNGTADVTIAGGTPPYTFDWVDDATLTTVSTDEDPTTLCAGDYTLTVTDDNGCTQSLGGITIGEPPAFVLNQDAYGTSCFGICDGAVDVDAAGGTPGYFYSWETFPGGVGIGATDSISGLCPGFYQVTVTDANGCDSVMTEIEVIEPPELTLGLTFTDPTCYDLCDGTATATPGGGTTPYTFTWTPLPPVDGTTATPSGMCAGTYDLLLVDDNGCSTTGSVTLTNPAEYDISSTVTDILCNGDADGAIDITVSAGGDGGPYTYTWVPAPPIGDGTPNVSGLTAGVWTVTIADGNLCDTTLTFTINEPPALTVTANLISDALCNGDCNGSVSVTIGGGTPGYNSVWDDPGGTVGPVVGGLCAGTYTVTVTDANGCVETDMVTVSEPNGFVLDISQVDNICPGECLGTATVNVISGGTGPYDIQWDDPLLQTTATAINLCAGVYTCTITDANLCDSVVTFTILEPAPFVIDTNVTSNACFGSCDGAADVVVAGGTGGYNYEWFDATTGLSMGVFVDNISGLCPGDYYCEITDAAGCVVNSDTVTIIELPEITTSLVSSTDATCGLCDGTAEVLATGGAGGFNYDWTPDPGAGDGTASVTGLCDGVYAVDITDAAGCTVSMSVTINSLAVEVMTMDSTDVTCFGDCDGTVTASWGSLDPPYTLEWFDEGTGLPIGAPITPANPAGETLAGQCAGTYIALLTNATGCVTSDTISINEPTEITATITPTDVTCNGACDGSAFVVVAGGVPGYNYNWVPLPGGGQGTDNAIGLCAGLWDVEVTDASGCTVIFSTTINEPAAMTIDLETSTDITCFGDNDGTATVSVSGGTAPLTYEWFDCATGLPIGQTTPTATGLGPGDYQCVITDANGCNVTSSCLPVVEPLEITATINIQQVSCFGDCDGMIDVIAAGGAGTYFYQWLDNTGAPLVGQTNDTIIDLCQDFYSLEITDINGCTATFGPFDLTPPADAWDVTTSQTNITCSGSCDGIAGVIVNAGNNPPYTYQWDDPLLQTTATATTLCAGVVNVTISDAGVCDTTITFTITDDNPIYANAVITNVSCNGDCTGEVTVAPSGGTGPYTVTWSDLQVGTTATGLCAGTITCTITDASGCVKDTIIDITEPASPLSASTTFSNPAACGVCNGSATVNMTPGSGTPPYSYDWDPDPTSGEGTNNALGLCPGVVTCTITDDNGCVLVETFAISDISGEALTMASTDASCFGVCDGTADVIYVCGDPGCTNEWFDGGTGLPLSPPETGTSVTGLCAGDYYVEVINASGCVSVDFVTISSPTQIIPNEVITPVTCNGDSDGAIDLAPTGGSGAGYSYVWTPAPPIGDGTANVSGLTAGTWCVDITDSDGCTESVCFDLVEPDPIVITPSATDVSCNGSCDGMISVTVTGGGGGYTFQWLDGGGAPIAGETGSLITGLCPGNYSVEVTDANGCVVTLSPVVTIAEPVAISGPVTFTDVNCFGDCDGTVTVTPAGGLPPYTIQWYDSGGLIGATSTTVTGLCPEDYYAVIQDANGCNFTTATVTITEPPELTATVTSNDASCNGFCDGDAEVFPLGGTPAYTYEWLDIGGVPVVGGTAAAVSNLCAGNYTIEVTDANGCSTGTIPVVINEFDAITGTVFTNDATCGVNDGNATVFASGGNPPLTYQWYDDTFTPIAGETSNVILNQFAGTYFVEVTDGNGCTEVFEANISNISTTNLTWDAVNHPLCPGDANGSLEITVTGANPPFTYEWDPGGSVAEDPTGLEAGTYTLEITDALGCINFYDTTLVDPSPIIVTTNSITPTDCGQCNGEIDVSVSGGTGALTTLWNNGETTTTITGLCAGIYEITVTDDNGCMVNEPITVDNNGGLTASDLVTAISCAGSCDGAVTVSGVGGTPPYTYLWLHDLSTSPTLTGLCAGTYFCEVSDDAGCTYTIEVPMLDPNAITATDNINNPACGASDGSITVLTDGGVLPHTYLWSTGGTSNSISGLGAGVYTLTVTDATGCTEVFVYGLSNESAPTAELTSTDVTCFGDCDGTVDTLSQTGGTAGFTYQWYDDSGAPIVGETNPLYIDVCIGDYMLEIIDAVGCISYQNISVDGPDTIMTNPLFVTDPTCFGDCDGSIVSNPFGGTLPFTFAWDDPGLQTTATATGLCDGTYTVTITDANGCIVDQTATLIEPPEMTITVDSTVAATCLNAADGEIYITVNGGVAPLNYEYTSATSTDTLTVEDPTGILPMTWFLTVTDANGCQAFDTIDVDTSLVVLAFAGNDSLVCFNDSLCIVGTTNIPSGATFSWSDTLGTVLSSDSLLCVLGNPAGATDYVFTVDYNGCIHTDTMNLTVNDSLYVEAGEDLQLFSTETGNLGGAPTSVFDGDTVNWAPPTYLDATDVDNPNIIQPQESGWYYVELTDSNGCRAIDSVYVEVLPDIVIPDGISPNADNLNDTWILDIIAQLNNSYPGVEVFIGIYNRWGDELYTSDETYANDWDGTREKDNERLPAGTYYYVIDISHPTIELPDKFDEPFTGPITVMW